METLGSAAIGSVIGWVLPAVMRQTPMAVVWSLVEAGIVITGVGIVFGLQAGAAAAAGVAIAAAAHLAWRAHLTRGLDT